MPVVMAAVFEHLPNRPRVSAFEQVCWRHEATERKSAVTVRFIDRNGVL